MPDAKAASFLRNEAVVGSIPISGSIGMRPLMVMGPTWKVVRTARYEVRFFRIPLWPNPNGAEAGCEPVVRGFDFPRSPHLVLLTHRGQVCGPAGRTAFDGRNVDAGVEVPRCPGKGHAWSHLYPVHASVSQVAEEQE